MKTKYDWSDVPVEVQWIATDADGMKCEYKNNKPELGDRSWHFISEDDLGDCYFSSEFKGNWKDSLEERPHGSK